MLTSQPAAQQRGFTLVEILIAVAILALVTQVLVPAGQNMLANSQVTSASNQVQAALVFARAEAKRLKTEVRLCGLSTAAATSCASGQPTYLGVIKIEPNQSNTLLSSFKFEEKVSLSWQGLPTNSLEFQRFGNLDADINTAVLRLSKKNAMKEVEVCFNGKITSRQQTGSSEC